MRSEHPARQARNVRSRCARSCLALVLLVPGSAAAAGRPVELVPPTGSSAYGIFTGAFSTTNDGAYAYWATPGDPPGVLPDGGATSGTFTDILGSRRGPTGWASDWLTPYPDPNPIGLSSGGATLVRGSSSSGGRVLFSTTDPVDPSDQNGNTDLYVGTRDGARRVTLGVRPGGVPNITQQTGASDDLSVVAFASDDPLLPADDDALSDVYAWHDGHLSLVSAAGDGGDPGVSAATLGDGQSAWGGAVSRSGRTIAFATGDPLEGADTDGLPDLYARTGPPGGPWQIKRLSRAGAGDLQFRGGSGDGRFELFTTATPQTAGVVDDGYPDLYRADVVDGGLDVVATSDAATFSQPVADGISDDGSTVVYASDVADDPADADGQMSLYRWSAAGGPRVLAALDPSDFLAQGAAASTTPFEYLPLRMTATGDVIAFETSANAGDDQDGLPDVLVVRGDGTPVVASGGVSVGVGTEPAHLGALDPDFFPSGTNRTVGRAITADGNTVFLSTAEALVPDDVNGTTDVYEWGTDEGVRLVSTGTAGAAARYLDSGSDGRDVFFASDQSLDGAEGISPFIYDARLGGGFPGSTNSETPVCEGTECQVTTTTDPGLPSAGSAGFFGPGDAKSAPLQHPRVGRNRTFRGAVGRLAISVPGPGRLWIAGPGIRTTRATPRRAGRFQVTVRLTARARRQLRGKGRLRVPVAVRFSPAGTVGAATRVYVTFRETLRLQRRVASGGDGPVPRWNHVGRGR